MRIVIDLQCRNHEWPTLLLLARAVARCRGEHEVFVLQNAADRERINETRATLHDILPPDALRIWSAPGDLMSWEPSVKEAGLKANEHIRMAVLATLEPDVLLLTGMSDDYREDCAANVAYAADLPTAVLLQLSPQELPSMMSEILQSFAYLRKPLEVFSVAADLDSSIGNLAEVAPSHLTELFVPLESLQNRAAPEWEVAASRIILGLEKIASIPAAVVITNATKRPHLAFVSPLPPLQSGIAEYSAQLLPMLAQYYEIKVIVDQEQVSDPRLDGIFPVCSAEWFEKNADTFDRVLYHFGNSPMHKYMHSLLLKIPGIVVMHDFYLMDWKVGGRLKESGNIVIRNHGVRALIEGAQLDSVAIKNWSIPANLEVLQNSTGVIVHSVEACRMGTEWYGAGATKDWCVVPLLRPAVDVTSHNRAEARTKLGFEKDDLVICTFGHITQTKLGTTLLSAFKACQFPTDQRVKLVFVGEINSFYEAEFQIENMSEAGKVSQVTGWVDTHDYLDYLLSTDIAVQLRSMSRGETSASVLDCLTHGIATIVNAHGSMLELDPETVMSISDPFFEIELTQALEKLARDANLRADIGAKAKREIGRLHAPQHCAELYYQAIENSARPMRHAVNQLPNRLADLPLIEADHFALATAMAHNFPPHPRQKSLFVDVTAVVLNDIHTGIQRVARAVLKALLLDRDKSYHIVPVSLQQDGTFLTAFSYAEKLLGLWFGQVSEYTIDVCRGDRFLGLDLEFGRNQLRRQNFERFRDAGATVWHVVYDLLPVRLPQYFPSDSASLFEDWLTMVTSFDGAACISHTTAEDLQNWMSAKAIHSVKSFEINWFHLGADIENSIPTRGLPDNAVEFLAQLVQRPTFLMVGTVEPRKGHAQTLAAFELLWAEGIDVDLIIVGKRGWDMAPFIEYLCQHSENGQRLFWFESISDEYLEKLYAASSCLIAASEGEGFGLPLIEAGQHGLPIMARGLRVFREIAGTNAVYFDGLEPDNLAQSLRSWLLSWQEEDVVSSALIPWLTWTQSALQLRRAIGLHGTQAQGDEPTRRVKEL